MPKICSIVSRYRRSTWVRYLARKCQRFMGCYENADDYNFETNGERSVLELLEGISMPCIFDVGANIGDWALLARYYFPEARIHCFEIMDSTASKLAERMSGDDKVRVNRFGLSNITGEVRLKCFPEYSTLTSMVDVSHEFASCEAAGQVMRGDEYCSQEKIDHVGFLKIDVEAAEWMVMQGLEGMLSSGAIDVIQFEYGTGSIITRFMLRDYYSLLGGHGYILGKIYPGYVEFRDYEFRHEDFLGPNFLAVRQQRTDLITRLSGA